MILRFCVCVLTAISWNLAYDPSRVTKSDLEELKTLPQDIYKHANTRHLQNPQHVLKFIWENRLIEISPILERFQLGIIAFGGGRNLSGSFYNYHLEEDSNLDPYAYVGIQARLNIIDPLEARQKLQEIQKQRIDILNAIVQLQGARIAYHQNIEKLKILEKKETLLKVRVNQAVSNLDERLTNLEKIHQTNDEINKFILEFRRRKQQLMELVQENAQRELDILLGDIQ